MTATATAPPPPAAPPPPPPTAPASDRSVPVTFGVIAATVGSVLALGGGGVLALAGTDGTLSSGPHAYSTPTSALVSETATFDDTHGVSHILGQPALRFTARSSAGGPATFVGVGPKAAVDRYLAGAAIDKVTDFDFDPFKVEKSSRAGDARPKPPASQTFWVARDSGRTASIDWKIRDGSYRIVVMNADGSRGVSTASSVALDLPNLGAIALAALLAGIVAILGGVALVAPSIGGPRKYAASA